MSGPHRCAGKACPGLLYKASEHAHPPSCAAPDLTARAREIAASMTPAQRRAVPYLWEGLGGAPRLRVRTRLTELGVANKGGWGLTDLGRAVAAILAGGAP